jgi:glycosyltransferase involved in cell wall biosynthesis
LSRLFFPEKICYDELESEVFSMPDPLVSLIVPVYNVAPYLPNCLDSIRAQTYPELEVLLVNDGSTDSSPEICRSYVQSDSRFRLIDKPNTGVSDSRNQALDQARGKYLQFLDSDDWLPSDATQLLVHSAETTGADLTLAHFYRVAGDRAAQRGHIKKEMVLTRQEFAGEMMKAPANYYYGVLWNKLYRRSIVEAHRLRFSAHVNWCEDFLFNLDYIEYVRLVSAIPKPVYYYRKREDSLVNANISLRRTVAMKRSTFNYYKELYQKLDLYEAQKAKVYGYLLSAATDGAVGPLAPKLDPPTA